MKHFMTSLIAILLSACSATIPTKYAGPDAGRVVLGFGAANGTQYSTYSLLFRSTASSAETEGKSSEGRFAFCQENKFCGGKFDYQNSKESGVALIASLPAGSYEVYNFDVFYNAGMVQKNFSSKQPVSIPFQVKPGVTSYLGNYQANGVFGKNLVGITMPAGAVFVVENRLSTDIEIARSKDSTVPLKVESYVPQAEALGSPFFLAPK